MWRSAIGMPWTWTGASQGGNAANEGCGFYIGGGSTNAGATLDGCVAVSNYSAGIRVFDSENVTIVGGVVRNNSQRGVGLHSGIELGATTAMIQVSVTGVRAFDDQGTATQKYGVTVSSTVDYYSVVGCDLTGNQTGGLEDGGGAHKVISDNQGTTITTSAPYQVPVLVLAGPIAETGTSVYVHNTVFPQAAVRQIPDAVNNSISYDVQLPPGTWRMDVLHYRSTNLGIYTFALDAAALTTFGGSANTIDGYNASGSPTLSSITGIVIPSGGKRRLSITMATKNASSTAYFGQINSIMFTRTA